MIKKFLFGSQMPASVLAEIPVATARVFFGVSMAFAHGMGKLPPSDRFIEGVVEMGFPMPVFFAWMAGLSEFVGGVLLALGLFTRPSALFIAGTMLVAAFGRHAADPFKQQELSLVYLCACLIFLGLGGGRLSIDRMFRKG